MSSYKNQVEAALMQSDIEENLELHDIVFPGPAVLENGEVMYLQTKITDSDGYVSWHWIARTDKDGLIFSDEQPDGLHLANFGV